LVFKRQPLKMSTGGHNHTPIYRRAIHFYSSISVDAVSLKFNVLRRVCQCVRSAFNPSMASCNCFFPVPSETAKPSTLAMRCHTWMISNSSAGGDAQIEAPAVAQKSRLPRLGGLHGRQFFARHPLSALESFPTTLPIDLTRIIQDNCGRLQTLIDC